MSITTMYLHNLAKRAATGGRIYPAEIVKAPQLIDKAYGNGDGHLDFDDVSEVASTIADKAGDIWDFITSIF